MTNLGSLDTKIGGLMVSKLITEKGFMPMFLYREKRIKKEDSGWRIFSGQEEDEYLEEPNNFALYNPSTILKIDDSIHKLLLKGVGSVFERQNEQSEWYQVFDFKLEDDALVEQILPNDWLLIINNLFECIEEDNGDLLYTTGDKSVRIATWHFDQTRDEIHQFEKEKMELRDEMDAEILTTYDFSDDEISRIGYKIIENEEVRAYEVIYGCSFIDGKLIQLAFYFDNSEDEIWAIETWKKIKVNKSRQ